MINFLDTSAVLKKGSLKDFTNLYISPITLTELENIKTNFNKSEEIKYLARNAVRDIINSNTIHSEIVSQKEVEKLLKKFNFLRDINDHRIICEAELLAKHGEEVQFVTADGAQYLFASKMPHLTTLFYNEISTDEGEYCGWSRHYLDNNKMNLLYSDPKMNILKC
jgi:hypothetical protein